MPRTGTGRGPLRSLHVITSTRRRGAQTHAVELAAELGHHDGHEPGVVALTGEGGHGDLPVTALGDRLLAPATLQALRQRVRAADVVVAHGSSTLPAVAVAAAGTRRPVVYRSIGELTAWTGSWARSARTRLLLSRMDAVVTLWPGAAHALVERFGLPQERVAVIPNAVAVERYRPAGPDERRDARRRFGLPQDAPVVAFVGALAEEKRPDVAVRAVAALDEAVLLVAGAGPRRVDLERAAATHAPGRVMIAGEVSDIVAVYWAADALVLPSHTEGMPAAPIEAALCGVPTAATPVGAVPEIVLDGRTGALFDVDDPTPAEALRRVLTDRNALGHAARARCRSEFALGDVADMWAHLLTGLHQTHSGSATGPGE